MDSTRTAVLALHFQHNVVHPDGLFGPMLAAAVAASEVVPRARAFHDRARDRGVPVVFTRFTMPDEGGAFVANTDFMDLVAANADQFHPDAWGATLADGIGALDTDLVSDNQRLSGLAATELPTVLLERGIDTLLVTGVATNLTVEQTARHATDLGFTVHVVSDCVTAADEDTHRASLANLALACRSILTAAEALAELDG
ncbi:cysteine hydrolase [Salsipaludibacter albus]|uniref:cysteine hydrolase n=1 Tax=Salsipaludibacter albus TaxID=2849650 RepID=UPI001EE46805|nr:cysteine hydrolase [Salsipaludibacter albus]MBY5162809.1 cysteine hydrolase [Salsipaludibacter albus]